MKILILILVLSISVFAQNHDHENSIFERFDLIRLLPPARITEYKNEKFTIRIVTKNLVVIKQFNIPKSFVFPKDFDKNWQKEYWIFIHCQEDDFLYAISKANLKK